MAVSLLADFFFQKFVRLDFNGSYEFSNIKGFIDILSQNSVEVIYYKSYL